MDATENLYTCATALWKKNRAFCIYRFPHTDLLSIAVEKELLPHEPSTSFLFYPFPEDNPADKIVLSVLNKEPISNDFLEVINQLTPSPDAAAHFPKETTQEEYIKGFNNYLNEINSGAVDKAILSRVIHIQRPDDFEPIDFFIALEKKYPTAFTYLFFHPEVGMWSGASPELLFNQQGEQIKVMALAGTQVKHSGGEYVWRDKEMKEHEMVGEYIQHIFSSFQIPLKNKKGPYTVESAMVAHLRTDYEFENVNKTSIEEIIQTLHPTPAVGGFPLQNSLKCIAAHESYKRKYYTGVMGETDFNTTASLYVNLRCMQIGEDKIALYVGGGLTAESVLEEEWEETILKSKTLINVIHSIKVLS